jgi:hypothetical protein
VMANSRNRALLELGLIISAIAFIYLQSWPKNGLRLVTLSEVASVVLTSYGKQYKTGRELIPIL